MSLLVRRFLPAGSFARNVATLTGATAFSQLLMLAALPVLTRLYAPGEYGAAAVYAGIVGLIVVIATLRYELAIPLPRSDRAALHVAIVALGALVAVVVAAGFASPFFYTWLGEETGLSAWVFSSLIMIGVLTAAVYQVVNYWAVRKSKFASIARTRIQQGVTGTGSQLLLGFAGFGVLGLIVGTILGQCAGVARLAAGMISDNRRTGTRIHPRALRWAARRYRRFPLYDSWAGLLNVAGGQAPVLLFAALFSPVLAGYYALAHRVLSAPLGLVGKAVSQVLLPRIVEANRRGEAGPLMLRLLGILAWLSFFPFTVLALVAVDVVPLAFGARWTPAAEVMAWTALWAAWQFVTSPLSIAMIGLEALRLHAGVQFALFALRIGGILVGAVMNSPEFAVIGFSMASIVGYIVYLFAILFVSRAKFVKILMVLSGPIALSLSVYIIVIFIEIPDFLKYYLLFTFIIVWIVLVYRKLLMFLF